MREQQPILKLSMLTGVILWCFTTGPLQAAAPTPPPQAATGPGGAEYVFSNITETAYGDDRDQFWIFEPDPRPESAPVVGFLHGWLALSPESYLAWIQHLVKKGNIVIFPRYQKNWRERLADMTPAACNALRTALQLCDGTRHTAADLSRFALVGHSLGGIIAANIAESAVEEQLPEAAALMIVHPNDSESSGMLEGVIPGIVQEHYDGISSEMLLLILAADDDYFLDIELGLLLYNGMPQIPGANKDFVLVRSDLHGFPPLIADHRAPLSFDPVLKSQQVDALDYYCYWKLLDALCSTAFYGTDRSYALGDTEKQKFMGYWSDGTPVNTLLVSPY